MQQQRLTYRPSCAYINSDTHQGQSMVRENGVSPRAIKIVSDTFQQLCTYYRCIINFTLSHFLTFIILCFVLLITLFFCSTANWTWDLVGTRHAGCNWTTALTFSLLFVLRYDFTKLPRLTLNSLYGLCMFRTCDPLASVAWTVETTCLCHQPHFSFILL